jgi:hypothetical protein
METHNLLMSKVSMSLLPLKNLLAADVALRLLQSSMRIVPTGGNHGSLPSRVSDGIDTLHNISDGIDALHNITSMAVITSTNTRVVSMRLWST